MIFSNSLKKLSFVVTGRIIGSLLQGIFYLVFASILEPEQYGQLSYFIALAGVVSIVSRFGLPYSVVVYQAKNNTILSNQANILCLIFTSVGSIILIPINEYAALLSFGISLFVLNQNNMLGLKKYKNFMSYTIIKSLLLLIIPISLYFVFDLPGVLVGMAISNFFAGYNFLKILNKQIHGFSEIKNNFYVLLHNYGIDASTNLTRFIDKLLIMPLLGFAFVGFYQFNLQILTLLEILPIALHSFLLSEESSGKSFPKIIYLGIGASIFLTVISIILSPILIPELFPKFSDGIASLQIISMSLVPLTVIGILNARLQARESTLIGYSAIIRIGLLLLLIFILGNRYGLEGLSFAYLGSAVATMIFLLFVKKISK